MLNEKAYVKLYQSDYLLNASDCYQLSQVFENHVFITRVWTSQLSSLCLHSENLGHLLQKIELRRKWVNILWEFHRLQNYMKMTEVIIISASSLTVSTFILNTDSISEQFKSMKKKQLLPPSL